MNLAEFNRLAGPDGQYNLAVITIHGMNTRGAWQKWTSTPLQDAGIRVIPVDYGYQLVRSCVFPTRTADQFVERVVNAWTDHDNLNLPICAVAHSFGTLILGRALQ